LLTRHAKPQLALCLAFLTLAGFALRLPLLLRFPLREDEAIYGYWALHALHVDPMFLHVWPDKPPIFIWALAAALQLWGQGAETAPAAMRLVNILASTLTIPLLAVCARRWWGGTAAVGAALLMALNPFAVSFAPTAYTDALLVLAGSLALTMAAHRRLFWSGIWLGIAIMTKQQGLFFVPLAAAAAFIPPQQGQGSKHKVRRTPGSALQFVTGVGTVVVPILFWDSLRWAVAPSPWDLGATNAGGVAIVPPAVWPSRADAWGELFFYLLASPWVWAVYGTVLATGAAAAWRRRAAWTTWAPVLLLGGWAGGFWLLHVGASVQVWDRYLLPLVIPLALLGGWAGGEVSGVLRSHFETRTSSSLRLFGSGRWVGAAVLAAILLLLGVPAARAAQGGLPVGADHGAYTGLDQALAAVDAPHALLFHRELGWQARFALFDSIQAGSVELRYYPSSVYLADSAAKSPHKERFVIVPDWAPLPDLPMQLAARRLTAHIHLRRGHFTVYKIEELPVSDASWRVCAPPPFRTYQLR
jgi:4-amino-4-deoxy-L-arabinose transferase-like glycosyltransferase